MKFNYNYDKLEYKSTCGMYELLRVVVRDGHDRPLKFVGFLGRFYSVGLHPAESGFLGSIDSCRDWCVEHRARLQDSLAIIGAIGHD